MLGSSGLYLKFVAMIGKLKAALLKCLLTPWLWISQKKKVRSRMGWHPSPIQLNVFLIESKERAGVAAGWRGTNGSTGSCPI